MRGLTLTLGLAVAAGVSASPAPPLPPAADQQLARDMLKSLVEINTTHERGSTEAAKAIQGWLLSAGFAPADVILVAPPDHPSKGNVVVRYRGKHSTDSVLFTWCIRCGPTCRSFPPWRPVSATTGKPETPA
jgi:hypothetical protein